MTGTRPGEWLILRPIDLKVSEDVWEYHPSQHKLKHKGKDRVIFIGPRAQEIVGKYLRRPTDAYCFSPREAEEQRRAAAHARRKTPHSCGNRPGSNRVGNPSWRPGERYTTTTYRRAIHRACDAAKVPRWSPNRLRHTAATELRERFGIEASCVMLGHAKVETTQIYAQRNTLLARQVAEQYG